MRTPTNRRPTHPGEILNEEFVKPLGLTQKELASRIGVSYPRLNQLIHGRRAVTPDTALRLARFFGTTPEFWLNLQLAYDLYEARQRSGYGEIVPYEDPAAGEISGARA